MMRRADFQWPVVLARDLTAAVLCLCASLQWVVYGSLGLFESFFDTVFFWMPFYFLAKIAFLIWAFAPQTKGAAVLYRGFLGPMFGTLQNEVHEVRDQVKAKQQAKRAQ